MLLRPHDGGGAGIRQASGRPSPSASMSPPAGSRAVRAVSCSGRPVRHPPAPKCCASGRPRHWARVWARTCGWGRRAPTAGSWQCPDGNFTALIHRDRPAASALKLGPQYDVRLAAVSPDGRWVATCSHLRMAGPRASAFGTPTPAGRSMSCRWRAQRCPLQPGWPLARNSARGLAPSSGR